MMYRVYECDVTKKAEITKILEADPYAEDSFARMGYKVKEGASVEEDKEKLFVYVSASEDFLKKADEKLKEFAKPAEEEVQKRVGEKIKAEEAQAEAGFGSIFGD
jgi:predicted RecB family nuclease